MKAKNYEEHTRICKEERENLARYLSQRDMGSEEVVKKIGLAYFDRFISESAVMAEMIDYGIGAAKTKNLELVTKILGAGAKVQKDVIYGVLIESAGGIQNFLQTGIDKYLAVLRDYVIQRFESGVTKCESILTGAEA